MQTKQKYLDDVRDILDSSGREHATTFNPEYCFDSIIDEGYVRIAIKASSTIDNFEPNVREELCRICSTLRCSPLIVGERTRKRPLHDGVVYTRGTIPAVTLETLRRMLEEKTFPFLFAKKGGIYVIMDGNKLKKAREAQEYSRGDLAEELGLSRRAIYEYERGTMSPTIHVALRLEELLAAKLIEPLSLTEHLTMASKPGKRKESFTKQTRFTKIILEIFSRLSFNSILANEAPFNLLTSFRKNVILSYLKQRLEQLDENRLQFLAQLRAVLKQELVIIASDSTSLETISGIPIVYLKDLLALENSSEFIALIHRRRGA